MTRRTRLLTAAGVVAAALIYVIIGGIRGAVVYYITPSELLAQAGQARDRTIRVGGQVVPGSKTWDATTQQLRFQMTDGSATVAVEYHGAPPGLFTEGQGAIVEGTWDPAGVIRARAIIVKHSEEYAPPTPRR